MSDRRPSKRPLFVGCPTHPEHADRKHDYMGGLSNYGDPCSFQIEPATVDEVLAHVRREVESGTIKGEVEWYCVLWENRQGVSEPCESGSTHDGDAGCHWRLAIPLIVECGVCGGSGQVFRPDVVDYDDVVTPECSNCRGLGVIPVSDGGSEI